MITLTTSDLCADIHRFTDIVRMGLDSKLVLAINQPIRIENNIVYVGDCMMSLSFMQMFDEVYNEDVRIKC